MHVMYKSMYFTNSLFIMLWLRILCVFPNSVYFSTDLHPSCDFRFAMPLNSDLQERYIMMW